MSNRIKRKAIRFSLADSLMYFIVGAFSIICLLPLLLILIVSFTDEMAIVMNGYQFIPERWSIAAYHSILHSGMTVFRSYLVSTFITVVGTVIAVTITYMTAFSLANKSVRYRNHLAFYFFFTMLFNAGIVPWFLMNRALGLYDNILALIIPSLLFNPFNMFLVRNFILGVPEALMESAKMDGANEIIIAFKIYFPLCIPVIAVITLFYALAYWNDWWNAIMLVSDSRLYPLQFFLFRLQSELQMLRDLQMVTATATTRPPAESVKMATVIITIGPIVLLYPFLQRYFIKGLVIGGVKG